MRSAGDPHPALHRSTLTSQRGFVGPSGWPLPQRARDLAPLLKVEVVAVSCTPRRLRTRDEVTVRVRGRPRDITRYWRRLEEVSGAINDTGGNTKWWFRRVLDALVALWASS